MLKRSYLFHATLAAAIVVAAGCGSGALSTSPSAPAAPAAPGTGPAPSSPAVEAPSWWPGSGPRLASRDPTLEQWKRQAAERIHTANAKQLFEGRPHHLLQGSNFWYSRQIQSRLASASPSATVSLDDAAVSGQHTDDLLEDDAADLNNVFRVIELQPQLVTLSMIGNDLRGVDPAGTPTQDQVNRAVEEILDSRQNLQEAIASLITRIPGADIALNTLYDNLAYNC